MNDIRINIYCGVKNDGSKNINGDIFGVGLLNKFIFPDDYSISFKSKARSVYRNYRF